MCARVYWTTQIGGGSFFYIEPVFCGLMMRFRYCDECSMKTTIFNDTTQVFIMHEGNAGVYFEHRVDPRKTINVEVDRNATYREWLFKDEANHSLFPNGEMIITNNDLMEFSAITIYMAPKGSVSWHGIKNRASRPNRQVFICIHTPHCMYNGVQ